MNELSKKFTFLSLMQFTAPTIFMMIFMSLYTMVDGIFVSRFISTSALSAVNIVYPLLNIVIAMGIMLATGGSAVCAIQMGERKLEKARESFSLITCVGMIVGFIIMVVGFIFIKPILTALGANAAIFDYCLHYTLVLLFFVPLSILQMLFQYFFVTAGKPNIGLIVTVIGGCVNIILDYIFIVPLNMGIAGAALATGIGFSIPSIFGLIYFSVNRKGNLYFVKPKFDKMVIWRSCSNGSSEMVTNLSVAVTTFLFNIIMIKYLGEDGVAAITVVLYGQYLLTAVFLGFSSGVAPVISYNYGNENKEQLKKIFKISIIFVTVTSVIVYMASLLFSSKIVAIFAEVGSEVYKIADNGFNLFTLSFLFMGINIFASAMFTAFSNGMVSAIISFLRTFLFFIVAIAVLPLVAGLNGIWLAVPAAESMALIVSIVYIIKLRKEYHYA